MFNKKCLNCDKELVFVFLFLFLIASISALDTKIVETQITLTYSSAGCSISCSNITSGNITGNITITQLCSNNCSGILKVEGENLLKEIQITGSSWTKTFDNNVIRELGNSSDITQLFRKVDDCMSLLNSTDKLNICMDSNRNVSVELLMCKQDVGYKTNFTECDLLRDELETKLSTSETKASDLETTDKQNQSNKWLWIGGAFILGIFAMSQYPKIRGVDAKRDKADSQFDKGRTY